MAVQDPVGMEWAARLMASLSRDAELTAQRPEAPAAAEDPGGDGAGTLPGSATPDLAGLLLLDPVSPEQAPAPPAAEPVGLLSTLSPAAVAPARPAALESPLLEFLDGAKLASVPAPPEDRGVDLVEASPLLASMRAREAGKPVAEVGAAPGAPVPEQPVPAEAAPEAMMAAAMTSMPEVEAATEAAPEAAPEAEAATEAEAAPEATMPAPEVAAVSAPETLADTAPEAMADAAPEAAVPAPSAPAEPDPAASEPSPAIPASAAPARADQASQPEPVVPREPEPLSQSAPATTPAAGPAGQQPEPTTDPFAHASLVAAQAALAHPAGAAGAALAAGDGPSWVALQHSLGSARSVWSAMFLGAAASTALPLRGAQAAQARGLKPVLLVTEQNPERMARLRSALETAGMDGGDTTLVATPVEADPARLGPRSALAADLLDAAATWDLLRIGLLGTAGVLLSLDIKLLARKVRWLMLLPNSRAEEAEVLCHLLRARWRLVAERPALLNPAAPAVASRPGGQLWRGPLD
ncbi:hypothetical protein ACLF3G_15990 [Falsiroseomonas sp. HC035]|uniref:hypothetical protein n=1 Tax=Falsiroseomonas sp. HC035 TaxID=3390999 RepID=UPI003D31A796